MRTIAYVDGFNLYYGCLKGSQFRWLDLPKLLRTVLSADNQLLAVKYYTALIKPRTNDTGQTLRQQIYLRALRTLPEVSIKLGHYLSHTVTMPLANPAPGQNPFVRVIKTEEKGTDVNLATHLLNDAYQDAYDVAVVVSNDSDLVEPISIVNAQLGKTVGIINPQQRPSQALLKVAKFYKQLRAGALAVSQLPQQMQDANGVFHKPNGW